MKIRRNIDPNLVSEGDGMIEFDSSAVLRRSSAAQLSRIMGLKPATPESWSSHDLRAMLRHQFAASLDYDLSPKHLAGPAERGRKLALTGASAAGIRTFADLLFRPEPPLRLLKLSKEFFKARTRIWPRSQPEWKVAYVFYLLSILVAGTQARKLSSLSSADLRNATDWALKQAWVDEKTKELILSARKRLPP